MIARHGRTMANRMLGANRLLGGDETELPGRVRDAIRSQGDATERLIGWIQLAVVFTFATLYA
ncbi:MAG: hypothetical protein IH900_06630, partial [Proteobacteria bacterium]|nr:hypothetical protein [Pseudomonadota bacterium]